MLSGVLADMTNGHPDPVQALAVIEAWIDPEPNHADEDTTALHTEGDNHGSLIPTHRVFSLAAFNFQFQRFICFVHLFNLI